MHDTIQRQKTINTVQTVGLLGVLLVIMIIAGWNVLGPGGLVLAGAGFALSLVLMSKRAVVGGVRGARRLSSYEAPELAALVDRLSHRAGLVRRPELFYLPTRVMNAAAAGDPDAPMLFVTDGILRRLNGRELEAVLAHEISHIRNRDLALFRLTELLRSMTGTVAQFGLILLFLTLPAAIAGGGTSMGLVLLLIAAPTLSLAVQLAVMRTREFGADIGAVELTGDPMALASALKKLEYPRFDFFRLPTRTADRSLFRTHPATDERIERLLRMGRRARRIGDSRRHPLFA